jgi:CBS domain-containing protein
MMVGEFMTRRVITIAPDSSIIEAAKLMLEHKVSGLPVIDAAHHVVGIVSEHDLLRRRESDKGKQQSHWLQLMIEGAGLTDESARFHEQSVNEVMTANPITVAPTSSLGEACRLIEERGMKRLPVVQNGKLVGIIARADLVRAFAQAVARATGTTKRDDSIDDRLRELERQIWRNRVRGPKPF